MKSISKKIEMLEKQIQEEKEKLLLYEEQRTKHMYNVFHGGTEYTQHLAQKEVNKLKTLIRKTKARIEEKENALSISLSDEKATQEILAQSEVTTIEVETPNKNYTQENIANEESIQAQVENKQEETTQENLAHEEVAQSEQPIQEDSIQGNSIESSFIHYIKAIIPMQDITISQEENDSISFNFTIKKSDFMAFKAPKVYSSYDHSLKIKHGQELARQKGIKIGLKKGDKRERKDKAFIIDQIKKLSISFNGDKNNYELSKILHCSLNRICDYKREIKESLENSQLNLFTE